MYVYRVKSFGEIQGNSTVRFEGFSLLKPVVIVSFIGCSAVVVECWYLKACS